MSLIKRRALTAKQLAANRRNQKFCHGPTTAEGRERIRAAHLRHGFYTQHEEVALLALGEDPAHYQDLVEGLWATHNPTDPMQEGLVIRLARAMWLMNRADRMQEGYALRQAQDVNSGRQDSLHSRMMGLKMTAESLERLAKAVQQKHYVTTPQDLEAMKNLNQEGELKKMGEMALALFYQLQAPGTGKDGIDPDEQSRRALARLQDIFGLSGDTPPRVRVAPNFRPPPESPHPGQAGGAPDFRPPSADKAQDVSPAPAVVTPDLSPAPADLKVGAPQPAENDKRYPSITAGEWEARQRPRHLLENILKRLVEACEEQRKAVLQESLKGPSPYERAAEIAPTHPNARLMRRMQDSNFREVRRVTKLLLKLKRHELKMKALEEDDE